MPFKIDYLDDGRVLTWHLDPDVDGMIVVEEIDDYHPRFYVGARAPDADVDLAPLRELYDAHPDVVNTDRVERRPGFRRVPEPVLAIDAAHVDRVPMLARQTREHPDYLVGDIACFNVDFSREFRYCLETDTDPTPAGDLSTLRLGVPVMERSTDSYSEITIDGDGTTGRPTDILAAVRDGLAAHDPDVLALDTSDIVPTLYKMAQEHDVDDFDLGRRPGYQELAGRSTFTSYGRVGHSPARYNVPGRAIIDLENTFFYSKTNLDGVIDLVARSYKPIQELAWASIGNVLTAIQIREAQARGVLTPWHS